MHNIIYIYILCILIMYEFIHGRAEAVCNTISPPAPLSGWFWEENRATGDNPDVKSENVHELVMAH